MNGEGFLSDEVERLRSENALLEAVAQGSANDRRKAEAEVERLRADRDSWQLMAESPCIKCDRLRAVLADTPENIDAVASEYCRTFGYKLGINFLCRCILNVLRARALKGAP